jgi:hypothetical protein
VPDRPGDMDERDVDARFASIVAHWDGPPPEPADSADSADSADPADRVEPADPAEPGKPADPAAPDSDAVDAGHAEPAEPSAPQAAPRSPWVNPSPLDMVVPASAWRAAEPTDPETEKAAAEAEAALEEPHFEPPEVTLPPQEDLHFWGAVIGLVAGPLMLLYVVFARPFHSTRWFVAAVVVSLIGFGLLVLRQPTHRDPTSGDDGARI